jgi:hypothetical protein
MGEELAWIPELLERMQDGRPRELRLDRRPLRGGLEAAGIARVSARYVDCHGRRRLFTLAVKQLEGATTRETLVYERLVVVHAAELAPRLLASHQAGPGRTVLYLEFIRPTSRWPWRQTGAAQGVLDRVGRLHAVRLDAAAIAALSAWNYEAHLQQTAERTLTQLERVPRRSDHSPLRQGVRWARRVTAALPAMRRKLLAFGPLGKQAIHGDLHPGNVLLRTRRGDGEAVLLDWGRARLGSPLEDVSSWLQSLGCWEPEARRRHDTLLRGYLSARGMDPTLGTDLREAYWLAGASNALAGALLHHTSVVLDARATAAARANASYSAREWLRVLRRADAFWS